MNAKMLIKAPRSRRSRRSLNLSAGITLFVFALAILVISFINAIAFTKYPFPGFFFQPNLYVSFTERENWTGMENGVKPLYRLQKIDGKNVLNGTQALKTIQRLPEGQIVNYTFETNDGLKNIPVKVSPFTVNDFVVTFLLPFLIGLFFLVTGFVVYLLNPLKKTAFIYYLSALFVALFFSTSLDSNTTYWFYRLFALYPLFGAASVHLILNITAANFLKKHPITEAIPYVLALIIVGFQQYYLYSEHSASLIYLVSPIFLVSCLFINFVYLIIYYITTKDVVARRKTRFYIIGLFFGTMIPALWSITFAMGKPLISLDWAMVLSIFYPIFTGYAITREDLFSLEDIVKTSLEYLVFTGIIISAYFIVVTISSMTLQTYVQSTPFINTVLTIVIIVALSPFRSKVQTFVDKAFYPERQDTLTQLNEVNVALSYVKERRTLGAVLSRKISTAISLRSAGLIYPSQDGKTLYYSSHRGLSSLDLSLHAIQRIFPKTGGLEYMEEVFDSNPPRAKRVEIAQLKTLSPQYFLPIGREKTRGILVMGEKLDDEARFIQDDFQFIKALYPQMEIALLNAELHEQRGEQEKFVAIGKVASVIVHEIKNPLGIIKLSSNTLKKRLAGSDPGSKEILGFIEEEADRMNDTVSNFLNFAKPKHPIKRNYSMEELSSYLTNIRPEMEKDGHIFSFNLDDFTKNNTLKETAYLNLDPDHLKQILLNLLINAKDATAPGGKINVDISDMGESINIAIKDSGTGITEELAPMLFDPFFTSKEHGTGLGLSVTKQLTVSNGGDIRWKNAKEGGAVFTLSFPRAKGI